ncbi:alpha/beta hydrolase [Kribbella sp. NPDC048915]|uniref:alpha/beta hydrolase n=1 Tax=Kribbella sp. NPDC048915 TaxID=3155148 RepID=UPI0033FB6964
MQKLVSTALRTIGGVSPRLGGRLAFELWRRPLARAAVRPSEAAVHAAARVEVVDGVTTYTWGDGRRPVLLVHGWRSRASRYAGFVTRLLELGYSPVSYDAPAHGDSGGDVVSILGHQRIIRALEERHGPFEAVIAHSLGVPFALYAVREGVAAQRLVMISGVANFGYLTDAFCAELGLGPKINRVLRRTIERRYFDGDDQIWTRFSVRPGKAELLVVHNDEDDVVDPAQARLLLRSYGDHAHFLPTTGLGHRRILSDPAVIAEAVAFVQDADLRADVRADDSDVAEGLDLSA